MSRANTTDPKHINDSNGGRTPGGAIAKSEGVHSTHERRVTMNPGVKDYGVDKTAIAETEKDKEKPGSGAIKKHDIFLPGVDLETKYANVRELDEFERESRNRKIIWDLVKPLLEDMDKDRRNNAMIDMKVCQMNERLLQMEYLCGVNETKPKAFQDIDN